MNDMLCLCFHIDDWMFYGLHWAAPVEEIASFLCELSATYNEDKSVLNQHFSLLWSDIIHHLNYSSPAR